MQDGYRILESGKSGKMAKRYQHHKFPPCLGYPKHEGKDKENLTHFFRHYPIRLFFYTIRLPAGSLIASADRIRETSTSCYPVFSLYKYLQRWPKETERMLIEQKTDKRETMRTAQPKPKIGEVLRIEDKRISPPICNNGRRNLR